MVKTLYIDKVEFNESCKMFEFHFQEFTDFKHNLENYIYVKFISFWHNRIYDHPEAYCLIDALPKDKLYYNKSNGRFFYVETDNIKKLRDIFANFRMSRNSYTLIPYTYNSSDQKYNFRQICSNKLKTNRNKFPYSFGIEFETSKGIIPEYECFKLGLIPLRDGSIGGYEYATIPMTVANLDLLKLQLQSLKQYTTFDSNCSMHIHFGNYPQDAKYLYILYRVFYSIQSQIESVMPKYTFHTELYKTNFKSYCRPLDYFSNFRSWCEYLHCEPITKEECFDLTKPHPYDTSSTSKWRIPTRYEALNFINALYFDNAKTVEFRFLKPSYNFNYIVNWICLFTFILQYAEKKYNLYKDAADPTAMDSISCAIEDVFVNNEYPVKIQSNFFSFMETLACMTRFQASLNDHIGLFSWCHDNFFKTNIMGYE